MNTDKIIKEFLTGIEFSEFSDTFKEKANCEIIRNNLRRENVKLKVVKTIKCFCKGYFLIHCQNTSLSQNSKTNFFNLCLKATWLTSG